MSNKSTVLKTITIDGPAGSGKSTICKLLAEKLSYHQVDSGAFYRAYTWLASQYAIDKSIDFESVLSEETFFSYLSENPPVFSFEKNRQKVHWNDSDLEEEIRKPEITDKIKIIADNKRIRNMVNEQIRSLSKTYNIIADGRDMGTVVFPEAQFKFFLTADLSERANRRYKEFADKFPNISITEVEEKIQKRDKEDETREFGALKAAADAIFVDTTGLEINAVLKIMHKNIHQVDS